MKARVAVGNQHNPVKEEMNPLTAFPGASTNQALIPVKTLPFPGPEVKDLTLPSTTKCTPFLMPILTSKEREES